jgi:hypothetical protein
MTTAANLLVILLFLSALYTLLGLLCGAVEKIQALSTHARRSREAPKRTPRRTPRRKSATRHGLERGHRLRGAPVRGQAA